MGRGVSECDVCVGEDDAGLPIEVPVESTERLEAEVVGLDCLDDIGSDILEEGLEECLHQ